MVDGELLLKAAQDQMKKYQEEFNSTEVEIAELEGKLAALKTRKEQIRGAYTSLYNICLQYEPQTVPQSPKAEVPKVEAKADKKDEQKKSTLSEEELKALKELKTPKTKAKQKQTDIPDYLKSEYENK